MLTSEWKDIKWIGGDLRWIPSVYRAWEPLVLVCHPKVYAFMII
jgi:hypothetical protein